MIMFHELYFVRLGKVPCLFSKASNSSSNSVEICSQGTDADDKTRSFDLFLDLGVGQGADIYKVNIHPWTSSKSTT